jgi:hypothetical protein
VSTPTLTPSRQRHDVDLIQSRPTFWALARTFNPDRRWFHPMITAVWAYSLAGVPVWTGLPSWVLVPVGLACTLLGALATRRRYSPLEYGYDQLKNAVWLTALTGLAATAWLVYAAEVRPTNLIALGVLILGALVLGGGYAHIRTLAPVRKVEVQRQRAETRAQREEVIQEKILDKWDEILEAAGCGGVRVIEKIPTKAGFTLKIEDSPVKAVKFEGLRAALGDIASHASAYLAHEGIRLSTGQVRAEETDVAHQFLLHVSTNNVFAEAIKYPLDRPVGTIRHPIRPGLYEDGQDLTLTMFGTHSVMVGATGSGKTVLNNNVIAETTHCCDALLWIAASDKLIPLIYPWLYPWFAGMTTRPMIDWVAGEDPQRVLEMLAAAYKLTKLRNKRLGPISMFEPSAADPAIVCLLEEASDLLIDNNTVTIKTYDGKVMTGSQLVNAIVRAARSAGVSLYLVTQYGLMDALGAHGSMAKRNITQRIAGKTYSSHDGQATLVGMNVDTTKLRHHTLLVQPSADVPRVIPAKAYELDGVDQIAPVAARNTATTPRLPAWLQAQLGAAYAGRWLPERLPELTEVIQAQGLSWPALSSVSTATVDTAFTELRQNSAVEPDTGDDETQPHQAPTDEEIQHMATNAEQKMDQAIETFRKYGSLGKTMTEVFEMIRAENAPEFVPAGQLAFVTGRVDRDGDWDNAGQEIITELRATPWRLEPVERDGELGWERATMMECIRTYLTGVASPVAEPLPEPAQPLAAILEAVRDLADDELVATAELGRLIGRIPAEANPEKQRSEAIRLGRELGAAPWFLKAQRDRTGSMIHVGELRRAAAEVAAGTRQAPLN